MDRTLLKPLLRVVQKDAASVSKSFTDFVWTDSGRSAQKHLCGRGIGAYKGMLAAQT